MPNKQAKLRKILKKKLNISLKTYGRTSNQVEKIANRNKIRRPNEGVKKFFQVNKRVMWCRFSCNDIYINISIFRYYVILFYLWRMLIWKHSSQMSR